VGQVNIYDPEQILSYSTEPTIIGTRGDIGSLFERAWREEAVSILSGEGGSFLGFEWRTGPRKLITYLPMWEERPMSYKRGKVLGVFEITLDVTDDYEAILRFQWIIAGNFLAFVGILFVTILFLAARRRGSLRQGRGSTEARGETPPDRAPGRAGRDDRGGFPRNQEPPGHHPHDGGASVRAAGK